MSGRGPWELDLLGIRYTLGANATSTGPTPALAHTARLFEADLHLAGSLHTWLVCEEICAHLVGGGGKLPNDRLEEHRKRLAAQLVEAIRWGLLTVTVAPCLRLGLSSPTDVFDAVDLADLIEDSPPPPGTTWLEIRVVDELGQAVGGLDLTMRCDGSLRTETTSGSGVVRIDELEYNFGAATIADFDQLREILEPRWESLREGTPPTDQPQTVRPLRDDIETLRLERETPHTLVITPRLGKLFVELHDKTGRIVHAERSYKISGPTDFEGTTDDDGRLLHTDVPMGDYTLTLTLEGEPEGQEFSDEYNAALVVLDPDDPKPQVRLLGVVPYIVMARVRGMVFETNKTFLLPLAMPSLGRLRSVYEESNPGELLVVGHTDTSGEPSVNDPLSLERAASVSAYLRDDVDAWLKLYDQGSPSRRWGDAEDLMMIQTVTAFEAKPVEQSPILWFQNQHNTRVDVEGSDRPKLDPDGATGPKTRRELVTDYMLLDGTSIAQDDDDAEVFDIEVTEHGCGENFPLDATGEELDTAAVDGQDDQQDRRVELFFFDREFGMQPPPGSKNSGPGSTEYTQWRQRATRNDDLWVGPHTLEGRITYLDGSPAAGVPFVVRAADAAIDGGYTDDDGRYRLTVFSELAEVALVDKFQIGKTAEDEGQDLVAVAAVPDRGGVAVA